MPYQNEFARGDSLQRLVESRSVKEFMGIIKHSARQETHELPAQLEPQRGAGNIKRVVATDGSTVTHPVQNGYPGAEAALFNLAAIVIKLQAIRDIPRNYIPGPAEIRDMEQCKTLSAVLPGRNIVRRDEPNDSSKRFFRATISKELEANRKASDSAGCTPDAQRRYRGRWRAGRGDYCPLVVVRWPAGRGAGKTHVSPLPYRRIAHPAYSAHF